MVRGCLFMAARSATCSLAAGAPPTATHPHVHPPTKKTPTAGRPPRSAATPRTGAEDEWNFGVEPRFGVEPGSTLGAGSTPNCPAPRPEEPGSTPSPRPPDRPSERREEPGSSPTGAGQHFWVSRRHGGMKVCLWRSFVNPQLEPQAGGEVDMFRLLENYL